MYKKLRREMDRNNSDPKDRAELYRLYTNASLYVLNSTQRDKSKECRACHVEEFCKSAGRPDYAEDYIGLPSSVVEHIVMSNKVVGSIPAGAPNSTRR